MLSKKYNYTDNEPVLTTKKTSSKTKKKIPKIEDEAEVYKKIKSTNIARNKKVIEDDDDDDDDENDDEDEKLSSFHPVHHKKYDEEFINNLKGENDTLKKHIDDLKKFHTYNSNLNNIHHYSHQMKIKLG